jgi:hypothetical protein
LPCVHVPTRPSRSLRPLALRLGARRRSPRGFVPFNPVLGSPLVEGLLVLRGLILKGLILEGIVLALEGLLLATAAPGRCFPQAECLLPECLQQLELQLTQEPDEQHDLADDESERDPTQ